MVRLLLWAGEKQLYAQAEGEVAERGPRVAILGPEKKGLRAEGGNHEKDE